jgi:AmmeMemoRadiSam system protein B
MSAHRFHKVRPAAAAGTFYPSDAAELRQLVRYCVANGVPDKSFSPAKAFILPHAGYIYSGSVAGTGYRCLEQERAVVRRIILLGPSHRMSFKGLAVTHASAMSTPIGDVPVDDAAITKALELPFVKLVEPAHEREHSLEVHLPFLQAVLDWFSVVPMLVGDASEAEVSTVLEMLWGGAETRIIVSSDLSHYHDHTTAQQLDRTTAERIARLEPVTTQQACGAQTVNGLLHSARKHGLRTRVLDLRNSGDTAGDKARVVGYGAFAFVRA